MNSGDCVEENKMDIFLALCMSYLGNKWLRVTRPSTVKLHFVLCQQKRADGISSTWGYERSDCSSNHFHWHIQSSCLYKLLAAYIPERGLCLGKNVCHCEVQINTVVVNLTITPPGIFFFTELNSSHWHLRQWMRAWLKWLKLRNPVLAGLMWWITLSIYSFHILFGL